MCTFPKAKIMNFRGECKSNVKINNKSPHCLELLHAVLSASKSMAVDFWNVACCLLIRDFVIGCSIGRKMLHAMLLSACCIGNHRLAIDRTSSGKGGEEDGFPPFSSSFLSFYPKIYVLLPMSSLCHVSCVRLACLWTGFEKEDWKALKRNE